MSIPTLLPPPQVRLAPSPLAYPEITERFTEFVVIIALMGAGLKLDRVFGLHRWEVTWRLILVTLPLSIGAITGLVVLLSILMHGLTVTPIMRLLDRKHGRDPDADATPPPGLHGPGAG